jgi:hypothetical protein
MEKGDSGGAVSGPGKKELWEAAWASFKAARRVAIARDAVAAAHGTYETARKEFQQAQTDHIAAAAKQREIEELLVSQECSHSPQQMEIA